MEAVFRMKSSLHNIHILLTVLFSVVFAGCQISGTITEDGSPVENVVVSIKSANFLTQSSTSNNGTYILGVGRFGSDCYIVTPFKLGYTFSPEKRHIHVSSFNNIDGINFEASPVKKSSNLLSSDTKESMSLLPETVIGLNSMTVEETLYR